MFVAVVDQKIQK